MPKVNGAPNKNPSLIFHFFWLRPCSSAYFKEGLQVQRNEKFLNSKKFCHLLKKMCHHFVKISDDLYLVISFIFYISIIKNFKTLQVQLHSQIFLTILSSFILKIYRFSPLFSTLTLSNLQLQLHKGHFTTANCILQLHKLSSVAR